MYQFLLLITAGVNTNSSSPAVSPKSQQFPFSTFLRRTGAGSITRNAEPFLISLTTGVKMTAGGSEALSDSQPLGCKAPLISYSIFCHCVVLLLGGSRGASSEGLPGTGTARALLIPQARPRLLIEINPHCRAQQRKTPFLTPFPVCWTLQSKPKMLRTTLQIRSV